VSARMLKLRIVFLLSLLASVSQGCRPLLQNTPWDLTASRPDAAGEEGANEEGTDKAEGEDAATEDQSPDEESEADNNTKSTDTAAAVVPPPVTLIQADWIVRVPPPGEQLPVDSLRWRHVAIEVLLAQPANSQPDFTQWLKHTSPVVAGNASIAAARALAKGPADAGTADASPARGKESAVVAALEQTARNAELKLPQRRAAIEALGVLSPSEAQVVLLALVDQYGDFTGPNRGVYSADLHVELLAALARHPNEQSLAQFTTALPCRAAEVRLAAVRGWPTTDDTQLPEELLPLAQDPDPRVRAECLKLLARCKHAQAFILAQRAQNDLKYEVRLAAVEALSAIEGDAALEELTRISKHPTEGLRAAAVKALAQREAWAPALVAADDEIWQVRLALAGELARNSTPAAERAAEKLLEDRSTDVQQRVVQSIAQWPWPRGGKLLLMALDSRIYQTRETASRLLSEQWAPAANFVYQAGPDTRAEAIAVLQEKWQAEFPVDELAAAEGTPPEEAEAAAGPNRQLPAAVAQQVAADVRVLNAADSGAAVKEEACTRLAELGADLPDALAALMKEQKTTLPPELYAKVLPELDANFKLLAKMEGAETNVRRQAASELRQAAAKAPLPELTLLRLVELVVSESDAVVWHEVQQLLENDMREPVVRLQYTALNHPTAEVQRRACLYLGNHGDARHATLLAAALEDENAQVVRAAAEAYGRLERLDNTLPLVRLLASRDRELVLTVSMSLARQGEESGGDGLERMTRDVDPKLRRRAIETMAELKQPRFIPALIRALDDQLGIKQLALDGLTTTVGEDIGRGSDETLPSMVEQIHRWKQWYAQQQKALQRVQQ